MELFDYEKEHIGKLRDTLSECTVLLKKDGNFPLDKPCKIAAYGSGVRNTVKGGTGSGEVNSRYSINIETGLTNAGFEITTTDWLDAYDIERSNAKIQFRKDVKKEAKAAHQNIFAYGMGKTMLEPEYSIPLTASGDAAIYVLSRNSGEGNDRSDRKGDVKLTDTEIRDILFLNQQFERFMLVLNVGGVVDLSPVIEAKNILLLSQLGVENGTTLASILLGEANPSGKLATTWAAWDDYAPMEDFENINDTRYREGIYVGYRYFDTFQKKTIFPFGYGLSYSSFETDVLDVTTNGETVTVLSSVRNTSSIAGKEVVQVYLSKPQGVLDQPYQELCAFVKTPALLAHQTVTVSCSFKLSDMASYDSGKEAYVLEKGDYLVRVGNHSQNTKVAAVITLSDEVKTLSARNVLGNTDFDDLFAPARKQQIPATAKRIFLSATDICKNSVEYDSKYEIIPEVESLSKEELAYLHIGAFNPKAKGMASIVGEAATHVSGAAGETTSMISNCPYLVMADGPAGLRLTQQYYEDKKGLHPIGVSIIPDFVSDVTSGLTRAIINVIAAPKKAKKGAKIEYQYCTAIPIGTAIAQSFNVELAEAYGDIVGTEMERFNVQLWLAPALNIHRSIRCGRNFEYYSEDPLVSGRIAAGITNGVQKHKGCGTTIKHYAANNKELNRYCNNSMVSERAMREIYLRGFGICVRESQPKAVMTSYNLLNGTHTAEHYGLIDSILRKEYGYRGIVMTDWVIALTERKDSTHRNSLAKHVAAAGGDLFMPGCPGDYKNLLEGMEDGTVSMEQIKINASRVISMARALKI